MDILSSYLALEVVGHIVIIYTYLGNRHDPISLAPNGLGISCPDVIAM